MHCVSRGPKAWFFAPGEAKSIVPRWYGATPAPFQLAVATESYSESRPVPPVHTYIQFVRVLPWSTDRTRHSSSLRVCLYVTFVETVPGKRKRKEKKNDDTFVVIKLRFFSAEPEKASRGTKKNGQGESEKSNRADRSSVSSQRRRTSSKLTMTRGIRVRPRLTFFLLDPLISFVCSNETV